MIPQQGEDASLLSCTTHIAFITMEGAYLRNFNTYPFLVFISYNKHLGI